MLGGALAACGAVVVVGFFGRVGVVLGREVVVFGCVAAVGVLVVPVCACVCALWWVEEPQAAAVRAASRAAMDAVLACERWPGTDVLP